MKLSNVFAKLTAGSTAKVLGGLVIAGAALTVAAPAAKAQVAFGVEVGGPRYYAPAPVYVAPGYGYDNGYVAPGYGHAAHEYWERRRAEEWREHQWRERQEWERHQRFDRDRGYGRGDWR